MEIEIIDPSPAYTPAHAARSPIDDDRSTISTAPSVSANLNLTPEHFKAHLRLLRAFQALKWRVQDPDSYPEVASRIPPRARSLNANDRWIWFLQLAVERYAYLPPPLGFGLCEHPLRTDSVVGSSTWTRRDLYTLRSMCGWSGIRICSTQRTRDTHGEQVPRSNQPLFSPFKVVRGGL